MSEIGTEIGKDRIFGGLLKTGQTTQYGGYEDDGYFQKGLSKLYTILTAGQYAGTTDITLNAKTNVHSNNCVYEQRTKLMWSRTPSASVGPASNGELPWTTNVNGEGIFDYAAAANAAKLAGYSDWRIPNILELETLIGAKPPNSNPDATAFPTWLTTTVFLSSSTVPSAIGSAYYVYFLDGSRYPSAKDTAHLVALVRGG